MILGRDTESEVVASLQEPNLHAYLRYYHPKMIDRVSSDRRESSLGMALHLFGKAAPLPFNPELLAPILLPGLLGE